MSIVISADEIKKTLPNYSPDSVEKLHIQSTKLADKEFATTLKDSPLKKVVLMSGGTASGKTEFLATHLQDRDYIIFDTTLPSIEGAKIKIKKIVKHDKVPIVFSVIPDDLKRAFIAFLHRDRKFSDNHFYRTHSSSRSTLLWIAKNYPDININLIESSYTKNAQLTFTILKFKENSELINYLQQIQMTETDIIKELNSN